MSIADLGTAIVTYGTLTVDDLYLGGSDDPLSYYNEVNLTGNVTGPFTAATTGKLRQIGNLAIVTMDAVSGTASGGSFFTFSTSIPALPYIDVNQPIWVRDGASTYVAGNCTITSAGVMTIKVGYNLNFQDAGTVGYQGFSICYSVYS